MKAIRFFFARQKSTHHVLFEQSQKIRIFETEDQPIDWLDTVENPAERFGSYYDLIRLKNYRFKDFYHEQKESKQ